MLLAKQHPPWHSSGMRSMLASALVPLRMSSKSGTELLLQSSHMLGRYPNMAVTVLPVRFQVTSGSAVQLCVVKKAKSTTSITNISIWFLLPGGGLKKFCEDPAVRLIGAP